LTARLNHDVVTMIEIRRYNASKHQAVLEFLPDRTLVHIGSACMSTLRDRNAFTDLLLPDGVWLAVADGAVAGALLVGAYDDPGSPCVAVYGIKVDEPYRRQGIGSMLMQKVEEFAQSVGIDRLFLENSPDNDPALALFDKYGYKISESSPGSVKLEKLRSQQCAPPDS
jgi:ribosomal protein S18 acetylase RimI-like enzyme